MKKKAVVFLTKEEMLVDLTLHDVSSSLLIQFVEKIVRPYYSGILSRALKDLIWKSIRDEEFVISHLKSVEWADNG